MSKCAAFSKFAQPAQRHKWSEVRRVKTSAYSVLARYCACGQFQINNEIPASVRRQFELESSVRGLGLVCECGHEKSKHEYAASAAAWLCTFKSCLKAPHAKCSGYFPRLTIEGAQS